MSLTRDNYIPGETADYIIETRNQPRESLNYLNSCLSEENIRKYPDMYKLYDDFSRLTGIPKDSFILTNGTENALRIVMQVLKDHENCDIGITESPSWGMAEVVANQVGFYTIDKLPYIYRENSFHLYYPNLERICNNEKSVLYKTNLYTNLFYHNDKDGYKYIDNNKLYIINDYTYTPFDISVDKVSKNKFIIGSFSKVYGCGIRLGFIIFDPRYEKIMNLYREQYVNPIACALINYLYEFYKTFEECKYVIFNSTIFQKYESEKIFEDKFKDNIICSTPYYYTLDKYISGIICKSFKVEEKIFYRVGRFKEKDPNKYSFLFNSGIYGF